MVPKFKLILGLILFVFLLACEKFENETNTDTFFHIKINDAELPVWIKGNTASSKFIVFINGGPGLTSIDIAKADMFNWSEDLEENFAMVYYDQRGCGNAQGNFDENTLTLNQYVLDLDAIISVLKVNYNNPDIFLMGHSFGGFIGANYLLNSSLQEKIRGWISIDGAYNFDYDLSWQYRRTFLQNIAAEEIAMGNNKDHWTNALNWADNNPIITYKEQKNEWRSFIGWPGERIIPEELATLSARQYLGIGFSSSYNALPAYTSSNLELVNNKLNEAALGINFIDSVSQIKIPALLIWGRYDDLIVPEEGLDVFNNFGTPNSDKFYKILPNSSHEPFISDPTGFKEQVVEFINRY